MLQTIRTDLNKHIELMQQLEGQLNENNSVLDELGYLDESNTVFKQIGPVLVRQELVEARQNIKKRIEYIKAEM